MMGPEVNYATRPAEDFARGALTFVDPEGHEVMVEGTNSWAYVGAGLRILIELLGPEYSMEFSSLNTRLKIFLSREVRGGQGQDLVEKQNAEQGLMPVVENEADIDRLCRREPAHGRRLPPSPPADRDFPRRRRRRRNADGTLSLGRNRAGGPASLSTDLEDDVPLVARHEFNADQNCVASRRVEAAKNSLKGVWRGENIDWTLAPTPHLGTRSRARARLLDGLKRHEAEMPFWDDVNIFALPDLASRLMMVEATTKVVRFRIAFELCRRRHQEQIMATTFPGILYEIDAAAPLQFLVSQCSATLESRAPTNYRNDGAGRAFVGVAAMGRRPHRHAAGRLCLRVSAGEAPRRCGTDEPSKQGAERMSDVVTLTMNAAIDLLVWAQLAGSCFRQAALVRRPARSGRRRHQCGAGDETARRRCYRHLSGWWHARPLAAAVGGKEGISQVAIPIAAETREDFTVNERVTGFQYRFVVPEPSLTEHEWHACLSRCAALDVHTRFVVCSGSVPPGVPGRFLPSRRGNDATDWSRIIIDSSGTPLKAALAAGVYRVLKPSLSELRDLWLALEYEPTNNQGLPPADREAASRRSALTLGEQGAILVTTIRCCAPAHCRSSRRAWSARATSSAGAMIWACDLRAHAGRGVPLWRRRRFCRFAHAGRNSVGGKISSGW